MPFVKLKVKHEEVLSPLGGMAIKFKVSNLIYITNCSEPTVWDGDWLAFFSMANMRAVQSPPCGMATHTRQDKA